MPVYKVELTACYDTEVEAVDEEQAGNKAYAIVKADPQLLLQSAETEARLSDCQYTDQQELKDREDAQ